MSLENIQALHNNRIAIAGNISASNDPQQQPHDANELLIKGASAAAAGRELGLSEEETLAAVSRQYRRQGSKAAIRARRTQEAEAQRTWSQKQASLGNWGDGELPGTRYEDQDELAAAFGEDQSDFQTFKADDRGFTEDEETGLIRRETFDETRGEEVRIAPQSALRDALTRLQEGPSRFGYDAFPGSADATSRLEDDLKPNREAEASLVSELVKRDNARFSPAVRAENEEYVANIADTIARTGFTVNGPGAMADESIGRIAEIRSLGKIGETAHVVRTANDAIKGQAARRHDGVFLDPQTGDPIAIQGPQLPSVLAGDNIPNNGSSSDSLNAPQTAQRWITETMPGFREGGRTFGDYPQVDITMQTTNFANRVRDYGQRNGITALQGVSSNIRSVDELQKVVSFVEQQQAASGKGLTVPDPERPGKSLPAGRNTTAGVMNALGVTLGEQQQLANAMFQLDAARRSSVNQNPTGTYISRTGEPTKGVTFDAKEAINASEGQAPVARIAKGSTIGVKVPGSDKPQRRSIVTELSKLDSPGAQKPFIGQVQGERPRVDRRKPGNMGSGQDLEVAIFKQAQSRSRGKPIDEDRLKQNTIKARLAEEREARDAREREARREEIRRYTPANLRQRGRYS